MFGGDDFFSEIERAFFGDQRGSRIQSSGSRSNVSRDEHSYVSNMSADFDRVENGNDYFVTVNFLSPVREADLEINMEDDFDSEEGSGFFSKGDKVLSIVDTSKSQSFLKIRIPKKFAKKDVSHTLNNGILEVRFER